MKQIDENVVFLFRILQITMYDIYVTNKSSDSVYVRVRSRELSSRNPKFHKELHSLLQRQGEMDKLYIQTFLVRWGFRLIPPGETASFATAAFSSRGGTLMYASLYARSELWAMDEEVDFLKFGCLFVRSYSTWSATWSAKPLKSSFSFRPANPEPVWIGARKRDPVPTFAVKASSGLGEEYFGRSVDGVPCGVSAISFRGRNYEICSRWNIAGRLPETSGDILQATGHQLYRVRTGDPVPPNAVIVGVISTLGSLYLGRVGGKEPCAVSTENGKIKHFLLDKRVKRFAGAGEILVLTNNNSPF